ncbi:hypothetical protein HAX54_036495, partial [Datura stramonium]|nr:hypothetical protein [Datura stramonium]
ITKDNIFLVKSPQIAPKPIKGKGVTSSSHGSKRSKRANEEEHDDLSLPQQPLRRYGLRWVTKQE